MADNKRQRSRRISVSLHTLYEAYETKVLDVMSERIENGDLKHTDDGYQTDRQVIRMALRLLGEREGIPED